MGISESPEYGNNNLVEFRTQQIKPFKNLFDSIKNNLPDTSIFFTEEGMKILQLDGAGNFLVNVHLEGENFEHYFCYPTADNVSDKSMVEINLSTLHLNQAFKSVTNDDNLFRFIYEKASDYVRVEFSSDKKSECRTYDIPIQNPDEESTPGEIAGTSDFPYCLTMPCADLQRICRDFKAQGCEKLTISHDGESLKFSSKGSVKATTVRTAPKSEKDGAVKFVKCPESSTYCDTFKFSTLNEFSKCQSGSDGKIVKILLSQGEPIVLYFEIGTLGTMAVAIAPHTPIQGAL